MPINLDSYLGIDPLALKLESRRMEVLANNLANADTPNFKAQDLDFQSVLASASAGPSGAAQEPALKYRVPLAPALDGNTVDAQLEQAAFAENTVRYQATLTFLSTKFRDLMTAITGS
jgi:flagellar basal-body rod protein FlgB